MIAGGNYKSNTARVAIESGTVDAIAFIRYFIFNPDLPERLCVDIALTPYDLTAFYGGGAKEYTDYLFDID